MEVLVAGDGPGREGGLRGLVRAWVTMLVRPRRGFREMVAPGDQAPGLLFAMVVVFVEETIRVVFVPEAVPSIAGGRLASAVVLVAVAVLLVTPAVLHLVTAIQTLLLMGLIPERAGVSETVQLLGYATAPCVFAGLPFPSLRVFCAAYGAGLLVVGLSEVHGISPRRGLLVGFVPAAIVFGYGFRGFAALGTLLARWYII